MRIMVVVRIMLSARHSLGGGADERVAATEPALVAVDRRKHTKPELVWRRRREEACCRQLRYAMAEMAQGPSG